MAKIDQLLQQVRSELGADFIATDVVGNDGLSIAGLSADPKVDTSAFSARFAMVMKLGGKVGEKLGVGKVEDSLTTTDQAIVIARYLGDGSYFWGIAVSKDAILGSVRLLMNEYADQLWQAIPH